MQFISMSRDAKHFNVFQEQEHVIFNKANNDIISFMYNKQHDVYIILAQNSMLDQTMKKYSIGLINISHCAIFIGFFPVN